MSSLSSQAALIVAGFDLFAVQSVLGAIRAADLSGRHGSDSITGGTPEILPRPVEHPTPRIEPRTVYHPTPTYLPRPVLHPTPRLALEPLCSTEVPLPPHRTECPIQPPWKVMPWENLPQPHQTIKVHRYHTDVATKGMLLDLFV